MYQTGQTIAWNVIYVFGLLTSDRSSDDQWQICDEKWYYAVLLGTQLSQYIQCSNIVVVLYNPRLQLSTNEYQYLHA